MPTFLEFIQADAGWFHKLYHRLHIILSFLGFQTECAGRGVSMWISGIITNSMRWRNLWSYLTTTTRCTAVLDMITGIYIYIYIYIYNFMLVQIGALWVLGKRVDVLHEGLKTLSKVSLKYEIVIHLAATGLYPEPDQSTSPPRTPFL
jgi:hypothetical protein